MRLNNRYTEVAINERAGIKTYQLPIIMQHAVLEYVRDYPSGVVRFIK